MLEGKVKSYKVTQEGAGYLAYANLGKDENGKPIRPKARGRTEEEALRKLEKMIDLKIGDEKQEGVQEIPIDIPESKKDIQDILQDMLLNRLIQTREEKDIRKDLLLNYYKVLIWNMSPKDRITMPLSEFNKLEYVLIEILESTWKTNDRLGFYKIYKETKQKYTYAIVDYNETIGKCVLQIIGQSDIEEKKPVVKLDEIGMTYARWLYCTEYPRTNYPIDGPSES